MRFTSKTFGINIQIKKIIFLKMHQLKSKKVIKFLLKENWGWKSTLVDLILGFQKPNSGEIFVDKKIYNLHETKWLQNISYVPQSIYMFDASIKYNITLNENDEEFDQTLFNQALKVADLENFVNSLPQKKILL